MALKTEKYRKYYLKCSNTFLAGCIFRCLAQCWAFIAEWLVHSDLVLLLVIGGWVQFPCSPGLRRHFPITQIRLFNKIQTEPSVNTSLIFMFFMRFKFTQTTQVWVHYFKSFRRVKSTGDEKTRLSRGNELKLTRVIFIFSFEECNCF